MYQQVIGGIVVMIAVAVTVGVGTAVMGTASTAFDCTTVDGYSPYVDAVYSGEAKERTKETRRGSLSYNVTFSHGPINAGDTADIRLTIERNGVIATNVVLGITITKDGVTTFIGRTLQAGTGPVSITFDGGAGQYRFDVNLVSVGGVAQTQQPTVRFSALVGDLVSTAVPAAYTGWAKTCIDTQNQSSSAWLLIPVILVVIAAVVILGILRYFSVDV